MSERSEKLVQAEIVKWLKAQGAKVVKIHGGPFQEVGLPDLDVSLWGWTLKLEVKRPGERATPIQWYRIQEFRNVGIIAAVVSSLAEVQWLVGQLGWRHHSIDLTALDPGKEPIHAR